MYPASVRAQTVTVIADGRIVTVERWSGVALCEGEKSVNMKLVRGCIDAVSRSKKEVEAG